MLSGEFTLTTGVQMEFVDVTRDIAKAIAPHGVSNGLLTIYNPHTTAGMTINEGADPDVQHDLIGALQQIVPKDYPYRHMEGNSPSHLMTMLTGSSVTIAVVQGKMQLGTWQRIFFCEYDGPRTRKVQWHLLPS